MLTESIRSFLLLMAVNIVLVAVFIMNWPWSKSIALPKDPQQPEYPQYTKKLHDPEIDIDTIGIIERWNYPVESHECTTEDGYILTLHRIPHGRLNAAATPQANRPVVFLQHGLVSASSNWVTNMPWQSAGFMFADAGFDVWMGNFRGNTYSKGHVSLHNDDLQYWAFSFDEMGEYDVPCMVDYVLNTTNTTSLHYVAHSEGTMALFIAVSQHPLFVNKISNFFGLAPIGNLTNIGGLLSVIAPWTDNLETRFPVYLSHTPAGTSTQTVVHFGQNVNSRQFQAYDYGSAERNAEHYNQSTPTIYSFENFTIPTYLYHGNVDILSDTTDVRSLKALLPCIQESTQLYDFNHMDFIWGMNAHGQIYTPIIDIILKHKQHQARSCSAHSS